MFNFKKVKVEIMTEDKVEMCSCRSFTLATCPFKNQPCPYKNDEIKEEKENNFDSDSIGTNITLDL